MSSYLCYKSHGTEKWVKTVGLKSCDFTYHTHVCIKNCIVKLSARMLVVKKVAHNLIPVANCFKSFGNIMPKSGRRKNLSPG